MIIKTKEHVETSVEQVWEEYSKLRPAERKIVAERILLDKEVSEDFIDHVLIKKAKQVKGKSVSLEEYKAGSRKGKA
ncbi:MAG: hypothetical protein HY671_10675 [Chloroflexi bacterium]|nr:hypothetical protein [Chloroflexota bacterium]